MIVRSTCSSGHVICLLLFVWYFYKKILFTLHVHIYIFKLTIIFNQSFHYILGSFSDLSQIHEWTNEYLAQKAGDEKVMVEQRSSIGECYGNGNEISMPFRELIQKVEGGDEMHYLTTQDVHADEDGRPDLMAPFMQKLRRNHSKRPSEKETVSSSPSTLENDKDKRGDSDSDETSENGNGQFAFPLIPNIVKNLIPQNINLWMGNSREGANSGLHHDYHDNLYILLRGRKVFQLYSPKDAERMQTRGKLLKVHTNGRINYIGEETTAYGADLKSDAAAKAAKAKDTAEKRLLEAEKAVEEGKEGAEKELEIAEEMLDLAMEKLIDAEFDDDENDDMSRNGDQDDVTTGEEDGDGLFGKVESSNTNASTISIDAGTSSNSERRERDVTNDTSTETDISCNAELVIEGGRRIVDKTVKNPNNFSTVKNSKEIDAYSAFCELNPGDILYLPASWFHEVTSMASASDDEQGHLALNYWFHPPDQLDNFKSPYSTDFWPNDFKERFE